MACVVQKWGRFAQYNPHQNLPMPHITAVNYHSRLIPTVLLAHLPTACSHSTAAYQRQSLSLIIELHPEVTYFS